MTKDEALKMAIEAMKNHKDGWWLFKDEIQACKEALEQPAQEPVVEYVIIDGLKYPAMVEVMTIHNERGEQTEDNCDCINAFLPQGTKLYTHPAPSWQGLSDDEITNMEADHYIKVSHDTWEFDFYGFARAIEQALKEKNT